MISYTFKSLSKESLNKLETYFDNLKFPHIVYSQKKFSKFYNLIVHYTGSSKEKFVKKMADVISTYVIEFYEKQLINTQLKFDFFYFSSSEQLEILHLIDTALLEDNASADKKYSLLKDIYSWLINSKNIYIDGLINFRLPSYRNYLNNVIESEINAYVIDKEYTEYIHLLQDYISSKQPQTGTVHLIYTDAEKTLLDSNHNVLTTTHQKKYLADISFSDNDFILNSILSLLPSEIIIHSNVTDKFLDFIQSIYGANCHVCDGCSICAIYKLKKSALE